LARKGTYIIVFSLIFRNFEKLKKSITRKNPTPMDLIKAEYEDLTQKIKLFLPIKAFPTRELVLKIKDQHPRITLHSEFLVADIINTGDISGILCMIECEDIEGLACALTHIIIEPSEPLKLEIEKYQKKRARRVDMQFKQTGN
jgi:hypothetical protein